MEWQNKLSELLGIQYPVIQAPMLGVTTPQMVAAISNSGGLGSLPVGGLSPEKTRELIKEVKQLTGKPFAVNLFVHEINEANGIQVEKMRGFLLDLNRKYSLESTIPDAGSLKFYTYKDQIDILIEEKVQIVSFTFGIPDDISISVMKQHGMVLIGTATSTNEAILLNSKSIDAIALQGIEAGGHRGSFSFPLPQVGLMALVPMVIKAVNVPVIASGAINSGATVKAAFALGAMGVQIGTAFIACHESQAIPAYKDALLTAADTDTQLTRSFSGRWARGITNEFMKVTYLSGVEIPPYPVQNSLTGPLRAAAQKRNNMQFTNLWAGQAATLLADKLPVAEVFTRIIKETEAI